MKTAEFKYYVDTFASTTCLCGGPKKRGFSFCIKCFRALPQKLQSGLYKKMRAGYEQAFDAATEYLQMHVW